MAWRSGSASLAIISSLMSVVAVAAEDSADNAPIVVTGSRIARPDFANPNPIVTMDAAAIERSGTTNVTEFLADNPALLGSQTQYASAGSNLSDSHNVGVNLLNLRNLGTSRTLVLVDGKRHVGATPGSAAVDINTIPTELIERVDVLTGGVSAVYGADGVSGVVNFVLKRDFEGVSLRAQNGISQRGDAGQRYIAATVGKNFADGRGNVALSYEFNQEDRFSQRQRLNYGLSGPSHALIPNPDDVDLNDPKVPDRILKGGLRWADTSPGGAIDLDGDGLPDYTGEGKRYDRGILLPDTAFTIGGDSTRRDIYYGDHTPASRRHNVNLLGHYEFSPALKLRAEVKYVKSKAVTEGQPSYDLYTVLFNDNAYLNERFGSLVPTDDAVEITFSRDNFDFGQRRYELDRELWRTVLGAEGEISDHLRYDLSFVFGQNKQIASNFGDRITDRYYAAMDAVSDGKGGVTCRINLPGQRDVQGISYGNPRGYSGAPVTFKPGECVPINLLGDGSPSQEALDFVLANHSNMARLRQYVVTAALSGDTGAFVNLPGGPIGFALGAEYRKEQSTSRPSDYERNGSLLDSPSSQFSNNGFDVKEVFGEVNLPILKDAAFAETLNLGAALRLSDYSTVGSTTTWNINATYAPVRDISFRGTYSRSVRAPNITELFQPRAGLDQFIDDPCDISYIDEGTSYREANCLGDLSKLGIDLGTFNPRRDGTSPSNSSLLGAQAGNGALRAETAKTWTAGVVLRPSFVPNLTMSFDWYDIKLAKAIRYAEAQDLVDLCYDQPTLDNQYCALIKRSPTTGYISDYEIRPENVASYRTAGLDMNVQYRLDLGGNAGRLDLRAVGNYLDRLEFVPSLGAEPKNELDSNALPAPRWSANFDVTWTKGPFAINYGIDWHAKTRRATREQLRANPDWAAPRYLWYKEKGEHDLHLSYDIADEFQLYGGVNNLLDTKPDHGSFAFPVGPVGRYFYVGVKAKLF